MKLERLPGALLTEVVGYVGSADAWRLELVSRGGPLASATSDCAARRAQELGGDFRWVDSDRDGHRFRPAWRHIALAEGRRPGERSGPYVILTGETMYEDYGGVDIGGGFLCRPA